MLTIQTPKVHFSEREAAEAVGVTVDQLRLLVRDHITAEHDFAALRSCMYQRSDVLLLKFFAGQRFGAGAFA